ncbi:hypothetical protein [Magnetospirillum aberrantis]|uniref:Uncharacterized protein n=1 Tax=Magnetospirillum aberrantis SpK TaxID=908842 RepID=A0A7C9V0N9_9PROT|nr:hypothetical protein [Magnetospirillum aberrantis]NFV81294.1 hypothetical protein [Magnetospirillum aberrantis SpK]
MPYPDGNSEYLSVLSAASGLAKSLFGDPELAAKHKLQQAQEGYYSAAAGKAQSEAQLNQDVARRRSMADGLFGDPNLFADAGKRQRAVTAWAQAYPEQAHRAGEMMRAGYAAGDPNNIDLTVMSNMIAGAGGQWGHTPLGFARADATQRRGQDMDSADRRYDAGLDYKAAMAGHSLTDDRERWKFANADAKIGQNETVLFSPERQKALGVANVFSGQASVAPGENIYPADPQIAKRPVIQGQPPAAGRAGGPIDVSPSDMRGMDALIGHLVPDGYEMENADRNAVLARAGELYQQSRDAGTAAEQAWREVMGPNPHTEGRWNPFWTNTVRPDPSLKRGSNLPAPEARAGGAQRDQIIREAEAALQRGADPAKVRERLRQLGVDIDG